MMNQLERNKAVVRKFVEAIAVPEIDFKAITECLKVDVTQHYQRPTNRTDAGNNAGKALKRRAGIIEEIGTYLHTLYRAGTIRITFEHMIAEGDWVSAQFILSAITARKGDPYENFYHFVYRLEDGLIAEYWEYVDSQYATDMLFS